MSFNAFLANAIRFQSFSYDTCPGYTDSNIPADTIAAWITALTQASLPVNGSGLMPPRKPLDVEIPPYLIQNFKQIIRGLPDPGAVDPYVKHFLTMVAFETKQTSELAPLFTSGNPEACVCQATLTWVNFLHPEWFMNPQLQRIKPVVDGSIRQKAAAQFEVYKTHKLVQPIRLKLETTAKSLINPRQFLVGSTPIILENGCFLHNDITLWHGAAVDLFLTHNAAHHSTWLMGLGKPQLFRDAVLPGAAYFSPWYSTQEVQIVTNAFCKQYVKAQQLLDFSIGLRDILPTEVEPLVTSYVSTHILNACYTRSSIQTQAKYLTSEKAIGFVEATYLTDYLQFMEFCVTADIISEIAKDRLQNWLSGSAAEKEKILTIAKLPEGTAQILKMNAELFRLTNFPDIGCLDGDVHPSSLPTLATPSVEEDDAFYDCN